MHDDCGRLKGAGVKKLRLSVGRCRPMRTVVGNVVSHDTIIHMLKQKRVFWGTPESILIGVPYWVPIHSACSKTIWLAHCLKNWWLLASLLAFLNCP